MKSDYLKYLGFSSVQAAAIISEDHTQPKPFEGPVLKGPGIAGITIEQANELANKEVSIAETIGEVKMKALIAYAELLRKKHPTWSKEKVAKKSAGLYNIKLV